MDVHESSYGPLLPISSLNKIHFSRYLRHAAHVQHAPKRNGLPAYAIALIGVIASHGTQVQLLNAHEVGTFAYVIPATIDLQAICGALALQLPGPDRTSRRIAGSTLTLAVIVSVAANVAGGHNLVARLAHAWPVIAYLLGELLANRVRTDAATLTATTAEAPAPRPRRPRAPRTVATPATAVAAERPRRDPRPRDHRMTARSGMTGAGGGEFQ
jgi:hypothetical protein